MVLKTEKAEYWMEKAEYWMHKELDKFILKILSDRTKKLYKKSGLDAEQYPGTYIGKFQLNVVGTYELYERNDKLLLSPPRLWVFSGRSIYTCIWKSNQHKKY